MQTVEPSRVHMQGHPTIEQLSADAVDTVIDVRHLVKRYKKATANAVDDISFSVPRGTLFALLGPNGAGKTTTISILTTTLSSTSGDVRIAGYDLATSANIVRQHVGIIFQKPSLDLNLTAEENVRFHATLYGLYPFRPSYWMMPRTYRDQVQSLAELLGIQESLFKPVKTFSGGMKRKLEIVRSLLHRPEVLFLDEPTAGLDPDSRRSLWDYLRQVRAESGTTVFLTTHYLEEAETAELVCIMNKGKIVANGTPEDIKTELTSTSLRIDALNRKDLVAELQRLAIPYTVDDSITISLLGRSMQQLMRDIQTPLTLVQTHMPTLEDAYLAIIRDSIAAEEDEVSQQSGRK